MAFFYKYEYTNKRKNIHPWGLVLLFVQSNEFYESLGCYFLMTTSLVPHLGSCQCCEKMSSILTRPCVDS